MSSFETSKERARAPIRASLTLLSLCFNRISSCRFAVEYETNTIRRINPDIVQEFHQPLSDREVDYRDSRRR